MIDAHYSNGNGGIIKGLLQTVQELTALLHRRLTGKVDLRGKVLLIDSDELLLVWEQNLRNKRLEKEEEAWNHFEAQYGKGSPEVTAAFVQWQEQLYAYIEQEKDRFLRERAGAQEGLDALVRSGAATIIVTKGARPYTERCFNLLGIGSCVTDIYSPAPGRREKRFVDAVRDHGKNTSWKCQRDTLIVGHDTDKDMAWDLVPSRRDAHDGKAPVFILFDTLKFGEEVDDPLDALPEIVALLTRKGKNDFLRGFRAIDTPESAATKNYSFKIALYRHPKRSDKVRIPIIYDIRRRRVR